MSWVAVGVAAFSVVSGAQQAESIRDNAGLAAQVNEMNAGYAELDAYTAELGGMTEEARYQTAIDSHVAAQRVSQAAQDVSVDFGTAKELQVESKLNGFLNQVDIREQAHAKALGYKNQARNIRLSSYTQAAEASMQASAIKSSSYMRAGEMVLSSAQRQGYLGGKGGSTKVTKTGGPGPTGYEFSPARVRTDVSS